MTTKTILSLLSALFAISCFIPYIRDIFIGKTKPHIYSWLIWTILQITGAISMFSAGAGFGVLSVAIGATLCSFVFILSFKYGTKNIKTFDTICLVGAIIALAIYFIFNMPILSIILVALIDLIGSLPTMRKAYMEPETETAISYVFSFMSTILALFALNIFSFSTSLYLISLVITNGLCAFIIITRRRQLIKN